MSLTAKTENKTASTQEEAPTKKGLVVTVTSPRGGTGKSSISLLLAAELAKSSRENLESKALRVCVVDLDVHDGQIGFIIGRRTPTALNIALSPETQYPQAVKDALVYDENSGIYVLLATVRSNTIEHTDANFYKEVIAELARTFDVVIIDTSVDHTSPYINEVALPLADAVILVTNQSINSITSAHRWLEVAVTEYGTSVGKIGVVVNRTTLDAGLSGSQLTESFESFGVPVIAAIPAEMAVVQKAFNLGNFADALNHEALGKAYKNLARKLPTA